MNYITRESTCTSLLPLVLLVLVWSEALPAPPPEPRVQDLAGQVPGYADVASLQAGQGKGGDGVTPLER